MKRLLLCILLTALCSTASPQSIDALRKSIDANQKELNDINRLLSKTNSSRKASERQIKLIRSNIAGHQNIIRDLDGKIGIIASGVADKSAQVEANRREIARLQREYAGYIYEGYKSSLRNDAVAFVFAAKDFNDATRRIAFLRYASRARRETAQQIDALTTQLNTQIAELNSQKADLDATKQERNKEVQKLQNNEKTYQSKVAELKRDASSLQSKAQQKRNAINAAQRKINSLIAAETKRKDTRTKAQKDADVLLSGQFSQNRGKLPYPVRGGVVIDHFGQQRHHLYNNLIIDNGGINIAGQAGDAVKCVFGGEVRTIVSLANLGQNTAVLVKHGDYFTVYQNLVGVTVKTGQKVSINQVLGYLPRTDNDDEHYLHFEIWQNNNKLDPEGWLNR